MTTSPLVRVQPRTGDAGRTPSPSDHVHFERAQLRRLALASLAEAATLVALLLVAVPLKHHAGRPGAVAILGPVHGLAFLAYCWVAAETVAGGGWTRREAGRLFLAALVPFGGLTNGPLLRRKAAVLEAAPGLAREAATREAGGVRRSARRTV